MSVQPKDPRLFELVSEAVRRGFEYVRLAEEGKIFIGTHDNWPDIRYHENGLPYITNRSYDTPKNYSDAIGNLHSVLPAITRASDEPKLKFEKEPQFVALVDYAKANSRLRRFFQLGKSGFSDGGLQLMIGSLLDRYIHVNDAFHFESDKLLPIYLPIEKYLFEDTLPAIAVVPILFLKFGFPRFEIDAGVWIEQLSRDQQLARSWHGPWGGRENALVESAATHALFISGHTIEKNHGWIGQSLMNPKSYPNETIDTFFASLRIATGCPTGYAQLLTLPVGWASGYWADLLSLEGPSTKKYPPSFERGMPDEVPTVSTDDADSIRKTFVGLRHVFESNYRSKVSLAMHRLNFSAMRSTDEDGIIDSMVAMEALLSDGPQEMTYKVAIRLAALYKFMHYDQTEQVFREMKQIYTFRSKIVHGDSGLEKHRYLKRGATSISAADAAVEHLRTAFAVLIANPDLLDPKKIDVFLLTDWPSGVNFGER